MCIYIIVQQVYENMLIPLVSCINGSMRLVGPDGPNMVEGRVEYCSNGLWSTISDNFFDTRDGEVVCRRLGYQNPSEILCTQSTLILIWNTHIIHRGSDFPQLLLW